MNGITVAWIWILACSVGWLITDSIEWRVRYKKLERRVAELEKFKPIPIHDMKDLG